MLYITKSKTKTLRDIVFEKHNKIKSDELLILSGFIGNAMIEELHELDIKVRLIYGLAKQEKMNEAFHNDLCRLHSGNVSIYCPERPSHAKIYIWKYKGEVVYVLNGSANFSATGLNTVYKEVLSEVDHGSFDEFEEYFKFILDTSLPVTKVDMTRFGKKKADTPNEDGMEERYDPEICLSDSIYAEKSKINWGHGDAHTHVRDAYIPIRKKDIDNYPQLFPEKSSNRGLGYSDNQPIDILWDDGTNMVGLLEGSTVIDDKRYPNKISTYKSKKILGDYLRHRLGLEQGEFVTKKVFEEYGRDNISISLISEGVYYMDFSV